MNPLSDRERLAAGNINPVTGLATDYLNHFNEAAMLLEMLASVPDFVADVLAWRPMGYEEYFATSHFKERDLAIAAYRHADPAARARLSELVETMNAILIVTRDALARGLSAHAAGVLGASASGWLKPIIARAGAVINGQPQSDAVEAAAAPQVRVDELFEASNRE